MFMSFTIESLLKPPEGTPLEDAQRVLQNSYAPQTALISSAISPVCVIANSLKNPTLTELQMLFGFGGVFERNLLFQFRYLTSCYMI